MCVGQKLLFHHHNTKTSNVVQVCQYFAPLVLAASKRQCMLCISCWHLCRVLLASYIFGYTAGKLRRKLCSRSLQCAVRSNASTPLSFNISVSCWELQNRLFLDHLVTHISQAFGDDSRLAGFKMSCNFHFCLRKAIFLIIATWLSVRSDVLFIFQRVFIKSFGIGEFLIRFFSSSQRH